MKYNEFLENYRIYTQGNETPEIMHLWCGLSTLAGAAEKKLWIDQEFFKIYLNQYVVLVGPPGVVAKSSSMGLGMKMLKEAGYHVLEGSVLKEKIIEEMETFEKQCDLGFTHSSLTFVANELNVLLSSGVDMIKFLVDIYDKDESYVYKTKRSGQYEIPGPYFNMISAAVPQWFGEYIASDLGSTGFLARCIIVYEEYKRGKYPRLRVTDEQKQARARCMEILYALSQMAGEVTLSKEADQFFYDWYMRQPTNPTTDYRINSYFERRNKIHLLKVSGLMALGDMRQEIHEKDMEAAVDILTWTEKKMRLAYIIAGNNKLAPYIYQVQTILEDNGGKIQIKELMRILTNDLDIEDIRKLLSTLEGMDEAVTKSARGEKWLIKKSHLERQNS